MLELWVKVRLESLFRRIRRAQKSPNGRAAIGIGRERTERIAGLEREVLLYGMDGGEVVVFCFAELEKARWVRVLGSVCSVISHRLREKGSGDGGSGEEDLLFTKSGRVIDQEIDYDIASRRF